MRIYVSLTLLSGLLTTFQPLSADASNANATNPVAANPAETPMQQEVPMQSTSTAFEPFTGKVTANRVRLRLSPSLEGPIVSELEAGQLFVITNAIDDYYAVLPQPGTKAYIFRTYVLDGVVEGQNVNIRLAPDTQGYIISQVQAGDKISGTISEKNPKWLEIDIPESVRFYIAKEYVEKVGNKNFFNQVEKARKQFGEELNSIKTAINEELKKPFQDIQLSPIAAKLRTLENQCAAFPIERERAETLFKQMQEQYLQISLNQECKGIELPSSQEEALHPIIITPSEQKQESAPTDTTVPSATLVQQEDKLIQEAISSKSVKNSDEFYKEEILRSKPLQGILTKYNRHFQNRPGDFLLVDPLTNVPVAFIYSTTVDLKPFIGKQVEIKGSPRPNHNYAFPAYFALTASVKEPKTK